MKQVRSATLSEGCLSRSFLVVLVFVVAIQINHHFCFCAELHGMTNIVRIIGELLPQAHMHSSVGGGVLQIPTVFVQLALFT